MEIKRLYTIIGATIGVILGYYLFWFFKNFFFSGHEYINLYRYFVEYSPTFLGFIGVVIFFITDFRSSSLLRFFMCIEVLSFPFSIFFYVSYFTSFREPQTESLFSIFNILAMGLTLALFVCSCIGLWKLSKEKLPFLEYHTIGSESMAHFSPAPASHRFLNRMIDFLVLLFIVYFYILDSYYFKRLSWFEAFPRGNLGLVVLEIFLLLYFYLILEGIFKTTPGKCATATVIVDEHGNSPSFSQILTRTFCRLIPFDALSFIGSEARGWHDSISRTYVVKSVDIHEKEAAEFTLDAESENTF